METITINMDNLTEEERANLLSLVNKANRKTVQLSKIEDGSTFEIGGITFIKFSESDGKAVVMTKDAVYTDEKFDDNTNDFSKSHALTLLKEEYLPQVIAAVGDDNVLEFTTDLTTLDGLKVFGTMTSRISLATLDFYRANTEIFDKYKLDIWWWLATAWSTLPHYDSSLALCVSPLGSIYYVSYYGVIGLRPFFIFKSTIFVSPID